MVDLESQLHRLLDQAAPMPPQAVNPNAARQRARKQRQHNVTAAVAVVCSVAAAITIPYFATRGQSRSTELTNRPSPSPSPSAAGPLDDAPFVRAAGMVLGLNGSGKLVRAWPGTDRAAEPVAAQAVPGGPSLIATDPITGGWVVSFTPESQPRYGNATQRLAFVSPDGRVEPFGPTFAASDAITGLAVSPNDGSVAMALFHTTKPSPAEIWLFSGAELQARTWVADSADVNEIVSLSWNQDGTQLAYIAGMQTGAGIAGNPSFLDVTRSGRSAPTDSPWQQSHCPPSAASWLQHDRFAVISECGGAVVLQAVNPHSGEPIGSPQTLGESGCLGGGLHPADNTDDVFVSACDALYVLHDGRVSKLHDDLRDAAWPGHHLLSQ